MHESRTINAHHTASTDRYRRFGVERLEVFGSATRVDFNGKTSDTDSTVHFQDEKAEGLFDRYRAPAEELAKLPDRPVGILTGRIISNACWGRFSKPGA